MANVRDLEIGGGRRIPGNLVTVKFSRSAGPGGQHVNKTSTKADVRLDLAGAEEHFDERELTRIRERLGRRMDSEGCLLVVCQEHRERSSNLESALQRMESLIREALLEAPERISTRPSRRVKARRVEDKRRRGQVKRMRSTADTDSH